MSEAQLGVRINALGIRANATRTAVLLELAGELAPAVIADMLGLDPGTAVRWVHAAAGGWNANAGRRPGWVTGSDGKPSAPARSDYAYRRTISGAPSLSPFCPAGSVARTAPSSFPPRATPSTASRDAVWPDRGRRKRRHRGRNRYRRRVSDEGVC